MTEAKPKSTAAKPGAIPPTGTNSTTEPLKNDANPTGDPQVKTGEQGPADVIDGQEHVLGDDPRRVAAQREGGYHDSMTGAPVDENGEFTEPSRKGTGPIPKHRIVANDWPVEREKIDDPRKREGNEASESQ